MSFPYAQMSFAVDTENHRQRLDEVQSKSALSPFKQNYIYINNHGEVNLACICRTNSAILKSVRQFNGRYQQPDDKEPEDGAVVHSRILYDSTTARLQLHDLFEAAMRAGEEDTVAALLVCVLPRLRKVQFVSRAYGRGRGHAWNQFLISINGFVTISGGFGWPTQHGSSATILRYIPHVRSVCCRVS